MGLGIGIRSSVGGRHGDQAKPGQVRGSGQAWGAGTAIRSRVGNRHGDQAKHGDQVR